MELIKPIVKVGNSAGVILPKEWLNGEAKVILVRRPENPQEEILEIVKSYLPSIIGLYLVGSYARKEQNSKSDIDVLAITTDINKKIKKSKYDINLISRDTLDESLKENILPLLPMLIEANPIINADLLNKYINILPTKHNLKWYIETAISALSVIKESLELTKEENKIVSENIMYSLVLRLRGVQIVNSLIHNKKATTVGLKSLIKKITGALDAYEVYQSSKMDIKTKKTVPIKEAIALYDYLEKALEEQKRWIKTNG